MKMLGKAGKRDFTCDCCDWSRDNKSQRRYEKLFWQADWNDELEDAWLFETSPDV